MPHTEMTPLPSQEFFESLISKEARESKSLVVIRFTASWCGPCQRVNTDALLEASDATWYLCDVDENDYTPGYCGVKTIPCFQAIVDGVPKPLFQSSDTEKIVEWLRSL